MSELTEQQESILTTIADAGGWVHPDTFNGRRGGTGTVVAGLVRRGMLLWERGHKPQSLNATGLYLTAFGMDQVDAIRAARKTDGASYVRSFDGATMVEIALGSFVNLVVARRLGLVSQALAGVTGRRGE